MTFAVYPIWHSALLGAYAGFLFHCYSRPERGEAMVERRTGAATGAETSGQSKVRVEAEHDVM
jgi:hypothetical protein